MICQSGIPSPDVEILHAAVNVSLNLYLLYPAFRMTVQQILISGISVIRLIRGSDKLQNKNNCCFSVEHHWDSDKIREIMNRHTMTTCNR